MTFPSMRNGFPDLCRATLDELSTPIECCVCSRISFDLRAPEKLRIGVEQPDSAQFSLSRTAKVPFEHRPLGEGYERLDLGASQVIGPSKEKSL